MNNNKSIAVIGSGIIGLAIAYKLSMKSNNIKVHIFEKEDNIGKHQSSNNSGVLHCGLYYKPNSLKAKLAVDGINQMKIFCAANNINHDLCGKVVVASDDREVKILNELAYRGKLNGLKGLKLLSNQELKEREPFVKAKSSLLVPEEGIVSYTEVMDTMLNYVLEHNNKISFKSNVKSIERKKEKYTIQDNNNEYEFDYIINCTGLFSDRTYENLTAKSRPIRIIPFRGEYMSIKKEYTNLVNHLVYPVPDPNYPFLGVHFTRMINGGREVGPNAVLALDREGYTNKDFSLQDTCDILVYNGFLKFIKNNFSFALGEFKSSISSKAFIQKAKKLIPELEENMFEKGTAGVRAQAMDIEGNLIMDFNIVKHENQIHVLNAPSPGATASLAIADYVIENYLN